VSSRRSFQRDHMRVDVNASSASLSYEDGQLNIRLSSSYLNLDARGQIGASPEALGELRDLHAALGLLLERAEERGKKVPA
jgi:hypothetical protein